MEPTQDRRVVKLGDLLPSFSDYDRILKSLKSYPLWSSLLREALLDRAVSGVACSMEEEGEAWKSWCHRNQVDPEKPLYEGLSVVEMRRASTRELQVEKFREQAFGKLLPEYFRSRKTGLDRVEFEVARFSNPEVAEELVFRCRGGEQSLHVAAEELADRPEGDSPVRRVGPLPFTRLSAGLFSLLLGAQPGEIRGPRRVGPSHVVVRVLSLTEGRLDPRTRQRLLGELLDRWLDQQMASLTGRPVRKAPLDEREEIPVPDALGLLA